MSNHKTQDLEHIPPVVGEYAYFDSRRRETEVQYIVSIKGKPEKIIKIIPSNNKDIN